MIKDHDYGIKIPETKDSGFENMFQSTPEVNELAVKANRTMAKRDTSIACLIIGIAGQILWLFPLIGVITGILGLVLSINGLKSNFKKGMSIAGLVLSIVCIFLSLLNFIVEIVIAQSQCNHNLYC